MAVADIYRAVVDFNPHGVVAQVKASLDEGINASDILNRGLIAPLEEVGDRFSAGDLFVPEMLMAAQAMKSGLEILKPHLTEGIGRKRGTVIIGTVKGDLHDIGKNLVCMMMEGAGFEVVDLGVDVGSDVFVKTASENGADVIALSALLTTTMPAMADTIEALKAAGLNTRTIIGGAPVTRTYADRIGADGYSADAPGAVKLVKQLMAANGTWRPKQDVVQGDG